MKILTSHSNLNSTKRRLVKIKFWQSQQSLNNEHESLIWDSILRIARESSHKKKNFCIIRFVKLAAIIIYYRFEVMKHQILRRGNKQDYLHVGSFQEAMRPVLFTAQMFALMPVYGIFSESTQDLRFSWTLIRTWYSLVALFCFGFSSGFNFTYAFRGSFNFDAVGMFVTQLGGCGQIREGIIFYTSIFLIAIIFFLVAHKWPKLMQHWQQVEKDLPHLSTEMERSRLAHRIRMITTVALLCSLGEHIFSMLTIIYYVNRCPRFDNEPLESFLFSNFANFFYFFEYTTAMGIVGKVVNVLSTFAWSFNDIFVMCLCVALSAKFRQLNEYMRKHLKKPTTREFWMEQRKNYRMLCRLCEDVDDTITMATVVGLINNLFFLCTKILKSLQKKPSITHSMYFWYSLIFLLARTFVLALYAAAIHDESKRPLIIFRSVRRDYWCAELKRFSEEVNADCVALSGMKFFHLTRSMVLSVAGTLLTYELVLLQFNKEDQIADCTQ